MRGYFRWAIPALVLFAIGSALTACGGGGSGPGEKTVATQLFEVKSSYAAVLAAAVRYESQPRCLPDKPVVPTCSAPAIVEKLRSADSAAAAALAAADAAVSAAAGDFKTAVGKAGAAVEAFGSVLSSFGIAGGVR